MMRLPIGTVIVALAAASCAPGDEATPTAGRGPALVEVEGPVVGLTIAAAIDERGDVVDPGRIFAASAPQIAAVAFAGPSPGEAVFEWYALAPGAGEEPQRTKLFE
ncbi:MAG TPA: hypothetical protein VM737_03505, partial [Gemmatimonadota bacterium]|nr:hypothetical protein [Gemmatimonadota bacterium]